MNIRSKGTRGLLIATTIGLVLATAACTSKAANDGDAGTAPVEGLGSVNVALVPGGSHPYFQPWKAAGEQAVTDFGLGSSVFNETAEN